MPRSSPRLFWRWLPLAIVLTGLFHVTPSGPALDRAFFDFASRHPLRAPVVGDDSAIVLIDDQTMDVLGRENGIRWPFPRQTFAALILALDRAGAKWIVMDFTFVDPGESEEQDLILAGVAAVKENVVLATMNDRQPAFWSEEYLRENAQYFQRTRVGNAALAADEDGVARQYFPLGSLAYAADHHERDVSAQSLQGALLRWHGGLKQLAEQGVPVMSARHYIRPGLPIMQRVVDQSPDLSVAQFASALGREPMLSDEALAIVRGRTVFVGANAFGTFDLKSTPVGKFEPGTLLHWTAWRNYIDNDFIKPIPRAFSVAVAAGVALMVIFGSRRASGVLRPAAVAGLLVAGILALAYVGISSGWFLAPATPVAAIFLTLLGVVAESFWTEERRKREIRAMFGSYVDPAVVTRLVEDPNAIALGGERREATVYFSDLAGFTDLSEQLPADQLFETVNLYLEKMSECLLDHGAYIDKYIGDAVMAVFGAPLPQLDHAMRACEGALAAQRVLAEINSRLAHGGGSTLAMRIGINTGGMLVGNLGSARKRNYTVLGDAVNLASRLEGANKEFGTSILLGETTARLVGDRLATRPLTRLRVKGKQEAVEVYELIGRPEELNERQKAFLPVFRDGYIRFVGREFAAAAELFSRAYGVMPDDRPTANLMRAAAKFSRTPPPPDWEPTLTLESK